MITTATRLDRVIGAGVPIVHVHALRILTMANLAVIAIGMVHQKIIVTIVTNLMMDHAMPILILIEVEIHMEEKETTMANLTVLAISFTHLLVIITIVINQTMIVEGPHLQDVIATMANLTVIANSMVHQQVIVTIVTNLMMTIEGEEKPPMANLTVIATDLVHPQVIVTLVTNLTIKHTQQLNENIVLR